MGGFVCAAQKFGGIGRVRHAILLRTDGSNREAS